MRNQNFEKQDSLLRILLEETLGHKKRVSYFYRTAQPLVLATFLSWGVSVGAGRKRLTHCKCI